MSVGSVSVEPATPGAPPTGSVVCYNSANQTYDPCVLTGQYDRSRNSTNVNASNLASFSSPSTFGLAYFYPLTSTPPSQFGYEPAVAQPLYITNVPQASGTANILLVASLNDYVYAFNTETGNQLSWSPLNLATGPRHCGTGGGPFLSTSPQTPGLPGAAGLVYYGIVATPVIDTLPSPPVAYVTSACVSTSSPTSPEWFLDAIDLKQGAILATQRLNPSGFNASNELSRASLLLTHPAGEQNQTDIYISFGAGVQEIGAANSGGSEWAYSGVLFGYDINYPGGPPYVQFTALSSSPFYTEGCPSGTCTSTPFPSIYRGYDTNGYPQGPLCATGSGNCSPGENWAVNGGGIWMSSKGPASDAGADIYVASGNGAFACASTGTGQTGCTTLANVYYWGESAITFPAATSGNSMGAPADFYAPHDQRYVCPYGASSCSGYNMPNPPSTPGFTTDKNPASYQTEELSRLDMDFGVGGDVIIQAGGHAFSMTSDKSGFLYVLPPSLPAQSQSLGQFQSGDVGLTNQTYSTQTPYQVTRYPKISNGSYKTVCETINDATGLVGGNPCDEVHELAWNNNLLFVWPVNETVEVFQGTYDSTTKNYSFGTSPVFDPCDPGCSEFPATSQKSLGAPMAVAANNSASPYPLATLWAVVPDANNLLGSLYGYTVNGNPSNPPVGSLGSAPVWYWDNGSTTHPCSTTPSSITGWFGTSFTEPTLADNQQTTGSSVGAVYVPATCVVNDGNQSKYTSCYNAHTQNASLLSGVLVFTTCP